MGSEHFLALANYRAGFPESDPYGWPKGPWFTSTIGCLNSSIWNWSGREFRLFQSIPTCGANAWTAFVLGGVQHLAVANSHNGSRRRYDGSANSTVFAWAEETRRFQVVQQLPTHGALDIEA